MKNIARISVLKCTRLGIVLTFVALACLASCKKEWNCTGYLYLITAIKGTDTITNAINVGDGTLYSFNSSNAHAMVSYYESNGYRVVVDSSVQGWQSSIVTDKEQVKALEEDGLTCTQ